MIVRRCTAILLLVTGLAFASCRGQTIPPGDEVTTRMNAQDEKAQDEKAQDEKTDDGSPRRDAGATPAAHKTSPPDLSR